DVATALDARDFYFSDIFHFCVEPQIFLEVVLGNMVSSHRCQNQIAVLDDHFRPTFEKATEPVRMIGDEREKPMHQDNHNAAANGCEKSRAAINRARQDGRQDNKEEELRHVGANRNIAVNKNAKQNISKKATRSEAHRRKKRNAAPGPL